MTQTARQSHATQCTPSSKPRRGPAPKGAGLGPPRTLNSSRQAPEHQFTSPLSPDFQKLMTQLHPRRTNSGQSRLRGESGLPPAFQYPLLSFHQGGQTDTSVKIPAGRVHVHEHEQPLVQAPPQGCAAAQNKTNQLAPCSHWQCRRPITIKHHSRRCNLRPRDIRTTHRLRVNGPRQTRTVPPTLPPGTRANYSRLRILVHESTEETAREWGR